MLIAIVSYTRKTTNTMDANGYNSSDDSLNGVDQLLPLRQPSQDSDEDDVEVLEEATNEKAGGTGRSSTGSNLPW